MAIYHELIRNFWPGRYKLGVFFFGSHGGVREGRVYIWDIEEGKGTQFKLLSTQSAPSRADGCGISWI